MEWRQVRKWLGRIGSALRPPFWFTLPDQELPKVRFRTLAGQDREACCEIYRLNEPGRFPDGYYDLFCATLDGTDTLFLVAEIEGRVIGFGGVSLYAPPLDPYAHLSFGMIHPDYQGQGCGTALLLARLAILPEPFNLIQVSLAPVDLSRTFYARFGFHFARSFRDSRDGEMFRLHSVFLSTGDLRRCRARLKKAGIEIELGQAQIPRIESVVAEQPAQKLRSLPG